MSNTVLFSQKSDTLVQHAAMELSYLSCCIFGLWEIHPTFLFKFQKEGLSHCYSLCPYSPAGESQASASLFPKLQKTWI